MAQPPTQPPKSPAKPPKDGKPAARRASRAPASARRAAAAPSQADPSGTARAVPTVPKPARPKAAARAKSTPRTTAPAKGVAISQARAWTIGAVVAAVGAGVAAFLKRGRIAAALGRSEGHVPSDLLDTGGASLASEGDGRAIAAFRPDMDAPMTAAEREALRPATSAAPSLVSDRGTMNAQTGPAN